MKLRSWYLPCRYNMRDKGILDEGMRRIETELEFSTFMTKFMILWQKLKSEVSKAHLKKLKRGKRFTMNIKKLEQKSSESSSGDLDPILLEATPSRMDVSSNNETSRAWRGSKLRK